MKFLGWIDLEMTGLNPHEHVIIEIASVVTDCNLAVIAEGPNIVIHQDRQELDKMDDWCKAQHGKTGLTEAVMKSQETISQAEQKTLEFLTQHITPGTSPICGNSIGTDRRFLDEQMPKLAAFFHYRNFDISTFKIAQSIWSKGTKQFVKSGENGHRALYDILQSIEEARYYMNNSWKCSDEN